MAAPLLERSFSWRGREVAWTSFGQGPPLVFCHGTPWSSWLWAPYARALAEDFTVHLWDMPGYGASSQHREHDVHLGVQGEVFADLLQHWADLRGGAGSWEPHVVAHDYGGAVSLRAALLHGARYRSLCLVDVVALRPWGSPFFTLVGEHADVFAALPAAVHRGALEAYVRGAAHRPLRAEDLEALVAPWLDEQGRAAFYRQVAQADERWTAQVEPLLGDLAMPVHVVWGAEDAWIPVDRARRLTEAIPGSRLTVVPDAGHLVQLDAPVALATVLARWLASVR
ncbi:alpha/beta hydrolase [Isoptericola chiayiensis]|uniref:Alpha/beta hydrolase n=1 Tax=Isoptericola chiayiensis TaxID=579446 RepID=A0ABP8YF96_9MICO|nr:alpha/beta hydrolase [Isoptericola chiayiensis]NOV99961.1 pimeloyl-ACP methyl ester carboxylesterase [Isoptericola chiayiensis]